MSTSAKKKSNLVEPFKMEIPQQELDRIRAVLLLIEAPYSSKALTVEALVSEFAGRGHRISPRTIYRWRSRYLTFGFPGLRRKQRSDRGSSRFDHGVQELIVAAAHRARRRGDIARLYRQVSPPISYESFRCWLRKLQAFRRSA